VVIYLDESGDLGFISIGGSRYFLLGALVVNDSEALKIEVRRFCSSLYQKGWPKSKEVKWYNLRKNERKRALRKLSNLDLEFHSLVLNKPRVYSRFHKGDRQNVFYNFLAARLLLPLIRGETNVHIFADNRGHRVSGGMRLQHYLEYKTVIDRRCRILESLDVKLVDSKSYVGLCAADLYCGAIGIKWGIQGAAHKTGEYYNIIKDQVLTDRGYLFI